MGCLVKWNSSSKDDSLIAGIEEKFNMATEAAGMTQTENIPLHGRIRRSHLPASFTAFNRAAMSGTDNRTTTSVPLDGARTKMQSLGVAINSRLSAE
jgi:hypothetical protein